MLTKQQVLDAVDWVAAMAAPRYAGGHEDVMRSLFGSNAVVIAEWIEDNYDGCIAFAYEFSDGTVAIITDSFGSCNGCDSWEGATDDEARHMINELAINARLFPDRWSALEFCEHEAGSAEQYTLSAAKNLSEQLAKGGE